MTPQYTIERYEHGWALSAPGGTCGIPMHAVSEALPLFGKETFLHPGIAWHLRQTNGRRTIFAVATAEGLAAWTQQIEAALAGLPPEEAWFKGIDTGSSSLAIFAVLAAEPWKQRAALETRGETPRDAEDFGRCQRLVAQLGWRARLSEVATAYPQGHWPAIVARWDELVALEPEAQTAWLGELRPQHA